MKEPIRMGESGELPPALHEAFAALGRDAPSVAVALRVQKAVEALPATAPTSLALGTLGLNKLLLVTTLVAGVVASAIVMKPRLEAPRRTPRAKTAIGASATELLAPAASVQATRVVVSASAASAVHEPTAASGPDVSSGEDPLERGESRSISGANKAPSARKTRALRRPLVTGAQQPTAAAAGDRKQAAPATPLTTRDETISNPAHETQEASESPGSKAADAQASEAQRLALCKRLAAQDPQAALRQVEALAHDLPNGVFAQERELLAIHLHERLGHRETAEQLARRFRQRYPDSVYRRTLAP
jgi:hypothetical protein